MRTSTKISIRVLFYCLLALGPILAYGQNAMFFGGNVSPGGPQVIATATGADETGTVVTSISTSSTLNIGTGQLIAVECYVYGNSVPVTTISDTNSTNTFTISPEGWAAGFNANAISFYAKNTVAKSSDTFTCNFATGQQFVGIMVNQITGASTSSPLDTHAIATGSGSPMTSGSFTTSSANELIIAAGCTDNNGSTFTPGANFILNNHQSGTQGADELWNTSSTQSGVTAGLAFSGGSTWAISVMTYH